MAQNTAPIFTKTPDIGFTTMGATQNTDWTMASGVSHSLFTAGTSGSYVSKIRFKPSGSTNAANVIRVYINNGGATTTAANNTLYSEISIPTITVSTTLAQNDFEIPMNIALPASYRLFSTNGGGSLTGGHFVTVVAGDY
jgi:hypothetical protein